MRLAEVDRGDGAVNRVLIGMISLVSGMRLPDAARVALYNKAFFGTPLGAWTHAAMRGASAWSVGERELMAAMVATWTACPFCVGAHGAVAARTMQRPVVDAALADYRTAPISDRLKATLAFLETLTLRPAEVTAEDAKAPLQAGASPEALTDAIAVCALFNIITRYANALDFAIPTADEFDRAASVLLKRGYKA